MGTVSTLTVVKFDPTDASRSATRFMERAASLAGISQMRHKHGALLVTNGNIRAVGVNVKQNDPKPWVPYDYLSTHAEVNALSQTQHQLITGTLYVARVNREGNLMPSMPCDNCLGYMMKWTNLRKVIHS